MQYNLLFMDADVILKNGILRKSCVACCDNKIIAIAKNIPPLKKCKTVNLRGNYLAPGFIDLHIHGIHNFLIDNGPADLIKICRILPEYGVTGFVPGVCPRPKGEDASFVRKLSSVKSNGARIFGFHMEGPFLTLTGALPKEALGSADISRVKNLIKAAKPYKAIFSIAPDFEDILSLIPIMKQNNTPVFITHNKATVKQAIAAIEAGARHATHFYDVFPPPPETEPGVRPCGTVEAVLADPRVSVDFILDGEHVDPIAVKMAMACKGPDRVCLITDANVGAGLPPGRHKFLGGVDVIFSYEGGPARLAGETDRPGVLAGSGLTLDRALRNALKFLDIELYQAIRMISANPAKVLGIDDSYGEIKEGYAADFTVLNKNLTVLQTWVSGECIYKKGRN